MSVLVDRASYLLSDTLGYLLCELAFKTDCRGPFAWAYRAGRWFYGKATEPGLRSEALFENPAYRPGGDEPFYTSRG